MYSRFDNKHLLLCRINAAGSEALSIEYLTALRADDDLIARNTQYHGRPHVHKKAVFHLVLIPILPIRNTFYNGVYTQWPTRKFRITRATDL